jgi:hypothetical protein
METGIYTVQQMLINAPVPGTGEGEDSFVKMSNKDLLLNFRSSLSTA